MSKIVKSASTIVTLLASVVIVRVAFGGGNLAPADWPQWRGPDRTDVSRETGLLQEWPEKGPSLLWTYRDAGIGYSGPSIVGDRLFSMGAREDKEYVFAVNRQNGSELWVSELGPRYRNGYGDGPRGTPTVDGDVLYAIGGRGDLVCLEVASGKERWRKSLVRDFGGGVPNWGYSESPLVDGDALVCTPGGGKAAMVALDKRSGDVVWKSQGMSDAAAYSSIIVAELGGTRQYVQLTRGGVVGVSAKDGQFLWRSERHAGITAAVPTPIFHDGKVYSSAGYGSGCVLLKLVPSAAETQSEEVYYNKNMSNKHGGVVLVGKHLYGYSEGKGWVCQDFETGETLWRHTKLASGSLTYADGHLYCYSEDAGTVVLIETNTDAWKEKGRFTIPEYTQHPRQRGHIWTHPVVAGGRLYLRDQELIWCYDVTRR